MKRFLRFSGGLVFLGLAIYGAMHLGSTAWQALRDRPEEARWAETRPLNARQQVLVSALIRILEEERVPDPARWASAIVLASPSEDVGYLSLVTAQIRRESRFLTKDLEWVVERTIPQVLLELGVSDPVHTIGPMQVQRFTLHAVFERALGRSLNAEEVKGLATTIESGVAAAVAVLDPIILEHFPDRRVPGWSSSIGSMGLRDEQTIARSFGGALPPGRRHGALFQKMVSDLTGVPLALDGVLGDRTVQAAALLLVRLEGEDRADLERDLEDVVRKDREDHLEGSIAYQTVSRWWRESYGALPSDGMEPRITHDPRLAFVLADFNSGAGCSRLAAIQGLVSRFSGRPLDLDGKYGPRTRDVLIAFFQEHERDRARGEDFVELLETGRNRAWVLAQAEHLGRSLWRAREEEEAPRHLVPDLWHSGAAQRLKGIGRVSVEGYVSGSAWFFEHYLLRMLAYSGRPWLEDRVSPASYR